MKKSTIKVESEHRNAMEKTAMLNRDEHAAVKELHGKGMGKKAIARLLEIDIKTVRKYLRQQTWKGYAQRKRRQTHVLSAYETWLKRRMPEVHYNASVLYQELKLQGYRGSYETVRNYSATGRKAHGQKLKACMRYETAPGKQSQVDWGSAHAWLGDSAVRVHFFAMVLGYSRRLYARAYMNEQFSSLIHAHQQAFRWFGGITEDILYDNPRTMVSRHDRQTGEVILNSRFKDFVSHYGFSAKFCRPYRPQTKGKIESGIKYLKRHFLSGRRFRDLSHLNEQLERWLVEVADQRIHGSTHQQPSKRFEAEKSALRCCDSVAPYCLEAAIERRVASDAVISLKTNRYSVPWQHAGQMVDIRYRDNEVHIYHKNACIAVHPRLTGRHEQSITAAHYQGLFRRDGVESAASCEPHHDPRAWDAVDVMVRDLNQYEATVAHDGGAAHG